MGDALAQARLAARVLCRVDQVLLGPRRGPQREEHAEPQVPDAGDRRFAHPARLDYVDIAFCHRADPHTPIEETVWAMHDIVTAARLCTGARPRRNATRSHTPQIAQTPSSPQADNGTAAGPTCSAATASRTIRAPVQRLSASAQRHGARSRRPPPREDNDGVPAIRARRSGVSNGSPNTYSTHGLPKVQSLVPVAPRPRMHARPDIHRLRLSKSACFERSSPVRAGLRRSFRTSRR